MTDEQAIRILSEKEGRWRCFGTAGQFFTGLSKDTGRWKQLPLYITSKDALAPVLEKLSDTEWDRLNELICERYTSSEHVRYAAMTEKELSTLATAKVPHATQFILMMSARDLAYAIAEAITPKK